MNAPESQIGFPQYAAGELTSTVPNDDQLIPLFVILHEFICDTISENRGFDSARTHRISRTDAS
jgi:hypothetical protein